MAKQLQTISRRELSPWQIALNKFFNRASVEIGIGVLVLASVMLTLVEFWLESEISRSLNSQHPLTAWGSWSRENLGWIMLINELITLVFIVELTLRYLAASSKRAFFAEFWLDIIATIPMFRIFRSARALRLLRLIRLLRLLGIFSRLSNHYPSIFRKSAVDFLMICGMLVVAVGFGTLAITHFENSNPRGLNAAAEIDLSEDGEPPQEFDLQSSFWFSIYTLLSGEPIPGPPKSLSSKLVTVFLMFMGMTIFAIFAGTVSAFMVDRMRSEGRVVEWDALSGHIVICGWTQKTPIIIREYRASPASRKIPVVVITEVDPELLESESESLGNVMFVHDDFTKVNALHRAGISRAKTCLVLSDLTGGRSEQDADARTILAALTVEKINESVYTCAELVNRSYASHLEAGNVNDFVVSGEYGAHILAQAAMKRGLVNVVTELMTYERGNEFYRVPIPDSWVDTTFDEQLTKVRQRNNVILVAVHQAGGEAIINPDGYTFAAGDEVVLISRAEPKLA